MPYDATDQTIDKLNQIRDQRGLAAACTEVALTQLGLVFWFEDNCGRSATEQFLRVVLEVARASDRTESWRQQAEFAAAYPNKLNDWVRNFVSSMQHYSGTPSPRQQQTIGSICAKAANQRALPARATARRRLRGHNDAA